MFWKKEEKTESSYDKTGKIPVIRASICTGERWPASRMKRPGI